MRTPSSSNSDPNKPLTYTFPAAAEALSVSRTFLYTLVRTGRLRTVRLAAKCVRIPASEVERLAEGR